MSKESFQIRFERSGGFTGMIRNIEINSKDLDPGEIEEFNTLIQDSDIFNFKGQEENAPGMPDQFQYSVSVRQGSRHKVVNIHEADVPGNMKKLFNHILRSGR